MFLGYDLLSKKEVFILTQKEIIFTKYKHRHYNTSRISKNDQYIIVPLIKSITTLKEN